tara:strand:+ start:761 stop:1372 length:612 start_codon:yes stop_codon:yes gene_type:complete
MLNTIFTLLTSFTITGKGPVTVFSSGLYGFMPPKTYSFFVEELTKDYSVLTTRNFSPMLKKNVERYCNQMEIKEFIFVSHSSFDHTILESKFCKEAFLIDPVSLPEFPLRNRRIYTDIPTTIIKCKYSYNNHKTNPFILPGFSTHIEGDDIKLFDLEAGHIDILDNFWANLGRRFRIYSMYDEDETLQRSKFRKYVVNIIKSS